MLPDNIVIKVENVAKRYRFNPNNQPGTLKSAVLNRFNWVNREDYWALQGVNLSVERGKTVGIIGNNGAGKSTLLRLVAGLSRPTRGRILRKGRLGSLLELGAGFNAEFSGRENVITGSILGGLTRKEAEANLEKIVEFAELADFIDAPVRTYSSGMYVRLAFSTQITLNPSVLLVDEVLAVGDIGFQKKCLNRLLEMKEQGTTILLVSHSMNQIQGLCDEVVWLEHGRVRAQGATKEIIEQYRNRIFDKSPELVETAVSNPQPLFANAKIEAKPVTATNGTAKPTAPNRATRQRTQEIEINKVALINELGQAINSIEHNEPLIIHVEYTAHTSIEQPIFMIGIYDQNNTKVFEIGNHEDGIFFGKVEGKGQFDLVFSGLPLLRGTYFFSIGAFQRDWEKTYCYYYKVCELNVEGDTPGSGLVYPSHRWQT